MYHPRSTRLVLPEPEHPAATAAHGMLAHGAFTHNSAPALPAHSPPPMTAPWTPAPWPMSNNYPPPPPPLFDGPMAALPLLNSVVPHHQPPYSALASTNSSAMPAASPMRIASAPYAPAPARPARMSFVQLLIRRKTGATSQGFATPGQPPKRHRTKLPEAVSRVQLTLVPLLCLLLFALTPRHPRELLFVMLVDPYHPEYSHHEAAGVYQEHEGFQLLMVLLIDPSLRANLAHSTQSAAGTPQTHQFQLMDQAMQATFQTSQYLLLRITRAALTEPGGLVLLKVETARPGDRWLLDNEEVDTKFALGIGNRGDPPTTRFIKNVLARPRYKAGMKVYVLPYQVLALLYADELMFRRDLVNRVVDVHLPGRLVMCTFDWQPLVHEFRQIADDPDALVAFGCGVSRNQPLMPMPTQTEPPPGVWGQFPGEPALPEAHAAPHMLYGYTEPSEWGVMPPTGPPRLALQLHNLLLDELSSVLQQRSSAAWWAPAPPALGSRPTSNSAPTSEESSVAGEKGDKE